MLFFINMSIAMPYTGILLCLFFIAAFVTSLYEKERRPALIFLLISLLVAVPYMIPSFLNLVYPGWLNTTFTLFPILSAIILLLPIRGNITYTPQSPGKRFDERDTMFSRRSLVPGGPR